MKFLLVEYLEEAKGGTIRQYVDFDNEGTTTKMEVCGLRMITAYTSEGENLLKYNEELDLLDLTPLKEYEGFELAECVFDPLLNDFVWCKRELEKYSSPEIIEIGKLTRCNAEEVTYLEATFQGFRNELRKLNKDLFAKEI